MRKLFLALLLWAALPTLAFAQVCPAGSTCATLDSYLGGHLVLGGALTTSGAASGATLALPVGGPFTFTFPSASKTLMATDYSNGTTLTSNALLTGGGAGLAPNAVAITGLVLGNGASAPAAYAGATCTNQALTVLSAAGAPTCSSITNAFLTAGSFTSITGTGTLTAGATGAGFTVALGTSTVSGVLAGANGGTGVANTGFTLTLGGSASLPAAPAGTQCLHMANTGAITATGSDCGAGGAVSLSASTANVVVSPNPITGTGTIGTQAVGNDQSAAGYTVLTGDNTKTIIVGAFTYVLPQAGSAGFLTQWSTCFLNKGASAATINTTTSTFLAATGSTSLSLAGGDWACVASDGTNWDTQVGRTASGTANSPLFAGGTGVAPTLGTRSGNTTTVATTSGTLTNTHVAAFDASGNIVDGGVAGSGSETLISNQSPGGAASNIAWTGLGSTYKYYHLVCSNLQPASADSIRIQGGEGGTPTWEVTGYSASFLGYSDASPAAAITGSSAALSGVQANILTVANTGAGISFDATIYNIQSTTTPKHISGSSQGFDGTNYANGNFGGSYHADNGAFTAIRVITAAGGNLNAQGNCSLSGHT